jgi:hypothetical protein
MNLLLQQHANGSFDVIDETGKVLSKGPMNRADAYAFIALREKGSKS